MQLTGEEANKKSYQGDKQFRRRYVELSFLSVSVEEFRFQCLQFLD